MGAVYGSLDRDDDVLSVGINRAVDLLARKMANIRTLGRHPGDKQPVAVRKGRFGPFVQHANTVANLPRNIAMEDVTLTEALALLAEKGKVLKPRGAASRKQQSRGKRPETTEEPVARQPPAPAASPRKRAAAPRGKPARGKSSAKRPAARRNAAE